MVKMNALKTVSISQAEPHVSDVEKDAASTTTRTMRHPIPLLASSAIVGRRRPLSPLEATAAAE